MLKSGAITAYKKDRDLIATYSDADTECIVNEDKKLKSITIPLPEPPDWKVIDNYGLPAKEQYFRYQTIPKKLATLTKNSNTIEQIWRELNNNRNLYKEEIEWIKLQIYREFVGYWFFNNGKPTYITGLHYIYCNFWHLDMGLPEYRDRDRKKYLFRDFVWEKPNFFGVIYPKYRREGATYTGHETAYFTTIRQKNAHSGCQSKDDKHAQKTFIVNTIQPWRKLPFFWKPIYPYGDNPQNVLNFVAASKRSAKDTETQESGSVVTKDTGLQSFIDFAPSTPWAYDGQKLYHYIYDEFGKLKDVDPNKTWDVVKECLAQGAGGLIHGFAWVTSTVEEMEYYGGKQAMEMCSNSMYHDSFSSNTGSTVTGLVLLFISALEGLEGFIGKYGESIIEDPTDEQWKFLQKKYRNFSYPKIGKCGSRRFLQNVRQDLINKGLDMKLLEFKRKFPIFYDECFSLASKNNDFPIAKIEKRINDLMFAEKPATVKGNFEWQDPSNPYTSRVVFIETPNGKWTLSKVLSDSESNLRYKNNGVWYPTNPYKYIAGADAFKYNKTEGGRQSDFGGAVFEERDLSIDDENRDISEWTTYGFRCTYSNRNSTSEDCAVDMIKMCVYYGCLMNPERNIDIVGQVFIKLGFGGFLKYMKNSDGTLRNTYGYTKEGKNTQAIWDSWKNYLNFCAFRENHLELLNEAYEIQSIEKLKDFDILSAGGGCLIGSSTKPYDITHKEDEDKNDISKYFRKFKRK